MKNSKKLKIPSVCLPMSDEEAKNIDGAISIARLAIMGGVFFVVGVGTMGIKMCVMPALEKKGVKTFGKLLTSAAIDAVGGGVAFGCNMLVNSIYNRASTNNDAYEYSVNL